MEVTLAVACEYTNATDEGTLNILGVFHELYPPVLPVSLQQMFLVMSWTAGPAEFGEEKLVRVSFMDQDNNEKARIEGPIVVPPPIRPGSRSYFDHVVMLAGLPVETPGEHAFFILVGGEEKRRVPLYVNEPPPEIEGEIENE